MNLKMQSSEVGRKGREEKAIPNDIITSIFFSSLFCSSFLPSNQTSAAIYIIIRHEKGLRLKNQTLNFNPINTTKKQGTIRGSII